MAGQKRITLGQSLTILANAGVIVGLVVGMVEGVMLLVMSEGEFQERYTLRHPDAMEFVFQERS